MSDYKIYHNPRCSKSRQTLALLEDNGIEPTIIRYLDDMPSKDELENILGLLGLEPLDIMRTKEPEFKAAGLDSDKLTRDEQLSLLIKNPKLLERPIVVAKGKAAIGRPPENVLSLI